MKLPVAPSRLLVEAVILGDPQGKGRPRMSQAKLDASRTKVIQGHPYTPAKTRKAEADLAKELLALRIRRAPEGAEVAIHLHFHLRTERRVDVDNLVKLFLDAANEVLFVDDCQIAALAATRVRSSGRPRTEVRAWMLA